MVSEIERRTIGKVTARLIPFLVLCYIVAYLDRVNVGFAALTMNKAIGLSAEQFGFGAGIFFIPYFLFEVPSNIVLERFGARKWIARIMFTWGLLSGAMALITGASSFYGVRLLLGAAEAGFFPGIIFFITLWFPAVYRARMIGLFMAAIPLSTVIGAPLSGLILSGFDGWLGLQGWQWLFLVEAVPALILAWVVLAYLTDQPARATWLSPQERTWLTERLAAEQRVRETATRMTIRQALTDQRVLALAVVYFGAVGTNYGLSFFLPQIVNQFGFDVLTTTLVSAIPFAVGVVSSIYWGRRSDAKLERRLHTVFVLALAGGGLAGAAVIDVPVYKMLCLAVAGFGIFASLPMFWTLPTSFLSGPAAAGGIAIINAIGNLAGFCGPYFMGWVKHRTGSFQYGLLSLTAIAVIAMVIVLWLPDNRALEATVSRAPAE